MKKSYNIHGEIIYQEEIENLVKSCRKRTWIQSTWAPRHAFLNKNGILSLFNGQVKGNGQVIENGWDHDHCEICGFILNEEYHDGYIDQEENWICVECFSVFINQGLCNEE